MTGSGDLSGSFMRDLRMPLKCLSKTSISEEARVRGAMPDRSTGRAKELWTLNAAAWLALWRLARPDGRTANSDFLWPAIRSRMWSRLPEEDQTMPTCSAISENWISMLSILICAVSLANWTRFLCLGADKQRSLVFSGASMT